MPTKNLVSNIVCIPEGADEKDQEEEEAALPEAAPIKCAGRESASLPALCIGDSVGKPALSTLESVGLPADSLPAHFIGAASG